MEQILIDSKRLSTRDSLLALIYEHHKFQRYSACADIYQDFFAFLDREGVYDSLKRKEMPHLYECIVEMYETDQSYATFQKIDQYHYSDRAYVEKLRKHIETGFEQRILQLSSEMNVDTLLAFKQKYPGVYSNDVESLLEKAKDKYRLSILRKISPASVKEFYDKFGGPDGELESTLEKTMYEKFLKERSREDAEDYSYRFPKGKNIMSVQEFLSHFTGALQVLIPSKSIKAVLVFLLCAAGTFAIDAKLATFPLWNSSWIICQGENPRIFPSVSPMVPKSIAMVTFINQQIPIW